MFPEVYEFIDSELSDSYRYACKVLEVTAANDIRQLAAKAAEILDVKDYARFDFRVRDGIPYLFDIAGTPYTIRHSSIAYLFDQYDLKYEDIYKVIVTCMLSNYRDA